MSDIVLPSQLITPQPRPGPVAPGPRPAADIHVRPATLADLPFIDGLQKKHGRALGFFPRQQMEEYVERGWMLVAEEASPKFGVGRLAFGVEAAAPQFGVGSLAFEVEAGEPALQTPNVKLQTSAPIGYIASRDRYMKRDELGAIFQMCVAPGSRGKHVAATLLQAVFDRAPYGCRLYCCWCAQDLEANRFWEAMGFVPLAFRSGGKVRRSDEVTKRRSDEVEDGPPGQNSVTSSLRHSVTSARTHIFWQKRIRADDHSTPYWFPAETMGGAIGAGRIVLPIPPGTHWSDAKPMVLPGSEERRELREERDVIGNEGQGASSGAAGAKRLPIANCKSKIANPPVRGLRFGPSAEDVAKAKAARREKQLEAKNDPRLVAAARELRDRWLEQVNGPDAHAHEPRAVGKYDVRRMVEARRPGPGPEPSAIDVRPVGLIEANAA